MPRGKTFQNVGTSNNYRSTFDLSYSKLFSTDMGKLIPIMCEDCIPGDYFKIGAHCIVRFQPMTVPVLHEINVYCHYFFVPYRLLDDNFEDFITKGITGDYEGTLKGWFDGLTTVDQFANETGYTNTNTNFVDKIWDYLGFGLGAGGNNDTVKPNAFPKQAYNFIYNEYYRDQNYIEPVDLMQPNILNCAWEKDYFTSAQPEQQRGTSPSFEVSGTLPIQVSSTFNTFNPITNNIINYFNQTSAGQPATNVSWGIMGKNLGNQQGYLSGDLSKAVTFNVNDLREAWQLQLWFERNQRGGVRYTEFLQAHFGVSPTDERLDRPEYIGGMKNPVIISEVLQTSTVPNQNRPLGDMGGHGLAAATERIGNYHVKEFGLIMGLMSIRPRTSYSQGIPRQWAKKTPFDFVFREFTNLSEQGIYNYEIYWNQGILALEPKDTDIFGFIGRYDEYRYNRNLIAGRIRDYLSYWSFSRKFNYAGEAINLNESFITMRPTKKPFQVQNEHTLIVNWGNGIIATRPLPFIAEPGLVDHS